MTRTTDRLKKDCSKSLCGCGASSAVTQCRALLSVSCHGPKSSKFHPLSRKKEEKQQIQCQYKTVCFVVVRPDHTVSHRHAIGMRSGQDSAVIGHPPPGRPPRPGRRPVSASNARNRVDMSVRGGHEEVARGATIDVKIGDTAVRSMSSSHRRPVSASNERCRHEVGVEEGGAVVVGGRDVSVVRPVSASHSHPQSKETSGGGGAGRVAAVRPVSASHVRSESQGIVRAIGRGSEEFSSGKRPLSASHSRPESEAIVRRGGRGSGERTSGTRPVSASHVRPNTLLRGRDRETVGDGDSAVDKRPVPTSHAQIASRVGAGNSDVAVRREGGWRVEHEVSDELSASNLIADPSSMNGEGASRVRRYL